MPNPVDEYLNMKRKTAAAAPVRELPKAMAPFSEVIGRSAASGAAMAAGFGLAMAAGKAYQAMTKKRDFEQMMSANPDLKDAMRSDPKGFSRHYTALRTMNPQFAAEPVVAGAYMRQMSAYPESAGKVVVEALQARKGITPSVSVGVSRGEPAVSYKT
jgi:hypothetical protein